MALGSFRKYQTVLARKRGINLSTCKILLLLFNKIDFIKRITVLNEYRILIGGGVVGGWVGGGCRQSAVLLTNYDITTVCFNVL